MLLSNSVLIFLATLTSSAISHPLNLLHSHHHHHAHHHLHLRLPFRSKAANPLQQPISGSSNNPPTIPAAAAPDISDIFVNLTIKTSSSSAPSSFLIPLRAAASTSSSPPHAQLLTSPVFQHPRTAQISHIQHGVSPADSSRPFERAGDVACYAHTTQQEASSSSSSPLKKRRNAAPQQQRSKQLEPFRATDGKIDFADASGKWSSAPAGMISGFECVLSPP